MVVVVAAECTALTVTATETASVATACRRHRAYDSLMAVETGWYHDVAIMTATMVAVCGRRASLSVEAGAAAVTDTASATTTARATVAMTPC